VPRGVSSKQDDELFCESDSIESVLSAFTSIYSGTTVGSLAVVAFVSSLFVHCFILMELITLITGVKQGKNVM